MFEFIFKVLFNELPTPQRNQTQRGRRRKDTSQSGARTRSGSSSGGDDGKNSSRVGKSTAIAIGAPRGNRHLNPRLKGVLLGFTQLPTLFPNIELFFSFGALCAFDFIISTLLIPLRMALSVLTSRTYNRAHVFHVALTCVGIYALVHASAYTESSLYATLYHWIRAQSMLKLLVVFNILEQAEKLLACFGNDCGDALLHVSRDFTLWELVTGRQRNEVLMAALLALGASITVMIHTFSTLLSVITINVALNSETNGLVALLVSNNFSEIRSAAWKKHTIETVFQIVLHDFVERTQYFIFVIVMLLQHVGTTSALGAVEPLEVLIIIVFEMVVDMCKHYFLCRYNNIPLEMYKGFLQVVLFDVVKAKCLKGKQLPLAPSSKDRKANMLTGADTDRYMEGSTGLLPNPLSRAGFHPFPYIALLVWAAGPPLSRLMSDPWEAPGTWAAEVATITLCTCAAKMATSTLLSGMAMRFLCRTLLVKRGKRSQRAEVVTASSSLNSSRVPSAATSPQVQDGKYKNRRPGALNAVATTAKAGSAPGPSAPLDPALIVSPDGHQFFGASFGVSPPINPHGDPLLAASAQSNNGSMARTEHPHNSEDGEASTPLPQRRSAETVSRKSKSDDEPSSKKEADHSLCLLYDLTLATLNKVTKFQKAQIS